MKGDQERKRAILTFLNLTLEFPDKDAKLEGEEEVMALKKQHLDALRLRLALHTTREGV